MKGFPAGLKRTRPRTLIWDLLLDSEKPLSAGEIAQCLETRQTPVWLSTTYRVLEDLEQSGAIESIHLPELTETLYQRREGHQHYAICLGCHRVTVLENCPFDAFRPQLAQSDFSITDHYVRLVGYCGDCQGKMQ